MASYFEAECIENSQRENNLDTHKNVSDLLKRYDLQPKKVSDHLRKILESEAPKDDDKESKKLENLLGGKAEYAEFIKFFCDNYGSLGGVMEALETFVNRDSGKNKIENNDESSDNLDEGENIIANDESGDNQDEGKNESGDDLDEGENIIANDESGDNQDESKNESGDDLDEGENIIANDESGDNQDKGKNESGDDLDKGENINKTPKNQSYKDKWTDYYSELVDEALKSIGKKPSHALRQGKMKDVFDKCVKHVDSGLENADKINEILHDKQLAKLIDIAKKRHLERCEKVKFLWNEEDFVKDGDPIEDSIEDSDEDSDEDNDDSNENSNVIKLSGYCGDDAPIWIREAVGLMLRDDNESFISIINRVNSLTNKKDEKPEVEEPNENEKPKEEKNDDNWFKKLKTKLTDIGNSAENKIKTKATAIGNSIKDKLDKLRNKKSEKEEINYEAIKEYLGIIGDDLDNTDAKYNVLMYLRAELKKQLRTGSVGCTNQFRHMDSSTVRRSSVNSKKDDSKKDSSKESYGTFTPIQRNLFILRYIYNTGLFLKEYSDAPNNKTFSNLMAKLETWLNGKSSGDSMDIKKTTTEMISQYLTQNLTEMKPLKAKNANVNDAEFEACTSLFKKLIKTLKDDKDNQENVDSKKLIRLLDNSLGKKWENYIHDQNNIDPSKPFKPIDFGKSKKVDSSESKKQKK